MPKLEKFSEAINDVSLLPDLTIRTESIGKHHCSPEQLVAIMNEILETLQGLTDCLKVADLFIIVGENDSERFEEFPDFWHGFDIFVFECAVKFLANEGFVQLEPNIGKNRKIEFKMIIGCHENARVHNIGQMGFFHIDQSN